MADLQQFLVRDLNSGDGHMVLRFDGRIDESRLGKAVRLSFIAQPIMGCRFVEHWYRPYWERRKDLDAVHILDLVETTNEVEDLQAFMELRIDPTVDSLVRVLVLRSESDLLCFKVCHLAGDAYAVFLQYASVICKLYNRLGADPDFTPEPNLRGRDTRQLTKALSFRQKLHLFRAVVRNQSGPIGSWSIPPTFGTIAKPYFLVYRIPRERVEKIGRFGRKRRATHLAVIMGAFYCALREKFPSDASLPISITTTVDLRYLVPLEYRRGELAIANFSGPTRFFFDPCRISDYEGAVLAVRDQEKEKFKSRVMGLEAPSLLLTFPGFRTLQRLLPFSWLQKRFRKSLQERDIGRCQAAFAHMGEVDPEELRFEGLDIVDAYGTTSLWRKFGLGFVAMRFRGELILNMSATDDFIEQTTALELLEMVDHYLPS